MRDGDQDVRRRALVAVYGPMFPLALDNPTPDDWAAWPEALWDDLREGIADAVHLGERNRRFYWGDQWISSNASRGPWREPPMPRGRVRAVRNKVKPAVDWRLQVITEQRPGFQYEATNEDPDNKRRTEANQRGVEYQWHRQKMQAILGEAAFWAALHGVSFLYSFWDPSLGQTGELTPGAGPQPLGDIDTRVLRLDQVRVSPNATATVKPHYWIIREEIPLGQAILEHGDGVVDASAAADFHRETNSFTSASSNGVRPLFKSQKTVARFLLFCEKSDYLPGGCQLVVVGHKVVFGPRPLVFGRIPIARVTDGAKDPRFFSRALFNDYVAAQTQINTLISNWFQSIRINAGGRIFGRPQSFAQETLIGGSGLSFIEVQTPGPLSDSIMPVEGFSVGNDVKEALALALKDLEDMTGWNDPARGSVSGDQSGRAILANREQLERVFAPPVAATAAACAEWGDIQVAIMRWGYQMPRAIAVTGHARPDLGRMLVSDDLDGVAACHVNPETMMPQPTSVKLFDLDQMYDKGQIDGREWRRRRPGASTSNIETPDDLQEAKAKRVCEAIRLGQPPEPMLWIDDEAIHQDVLQHEILLAPNMAPEVLQAAMDRWTQLADQAMQKAQMGGPMAPPPASPPSASAIASAGADSPFNPGPTGQPLAQASPSVAAPPAPTALAPAPQPTIQGAAAQSFEQVAPQ
jgi:hypothetical protein